MSTLYVGLDVSLLSVVASFILDDDTKASSRLTFPNNPKGVDKLVERINSICIRINPTDIQIGLECTGNLGTGLTDLLRSHPGIEHLQPVVHPLNAKHVAKLKKVYDLPKTDPIDALMVAQYLRFRRLPPPIVPDEKYLALQKLTRHRFHLVQSLTQEKNRFLSNLFLKFSAFRQQKPLSDAFGATASALLTDSLTVDEIAAKPLEELVELLREKGRDHFADPEQTAHDILEAAQNSYKLKKGLADPVNLILSMTMQNIRFFERQIKEIDKAITKHLAAFRTDATILLSIEGIGPVFTAGMIAEIQDVHRFHSDSALAKFASIVWKKNQSGLFDGDDTPMMHCGNKYLKYYFTEAANCVRMHNEEFRLYYLSKFRESSTHQHKRACALTARKLVRLVFNLLHKGVLYKPQEKRKEDCAANPLPEGTTQGELVRHITRRRRAQRALRIHRD